MSVMEEDMAEFFFSFEVLLAAGALLGLPFITKISCIRESIQILSQIQILVLIL